MVNNQLKQARRSANIFSKLFPNKRYYVVGHHLRYENGTVKSSETFCIQEGHHDDIIRGGSKIYSTYVNGKEVFRRNQ